MAMDNTISTEIHLAGILNIVATEAPAFAFYQYIINMPSEWHSEERLVQEAAISAPEAANKFADTPSIIESDVIKTELTADIPTSRYWLFVSNDNQLVEDLSWKQPFAQHEVKYPVSEIVIEKSASRSVSYKLEPKGLDFYEDQLLSLQLTLPRYTTKAIEPEQIVQETMREPASELSEIDTTNDELIELVDKNILQYTIADALAALLTSYSPEQIANVSPDASRYPFHMASDQHNIYFLNNGIANVGGQVLNLNGSSFINYNAQLDTGIGEASSDIHRLHLVTDNSINLSQHVFAGAIAADQTGTVLTFSSEHAGYTYTVNGGMNANLFSIDAQNNLVLNQAQSGGETLNVTVNISNGTIAVTQQFNIFIAGEEQGGEEQVSEEEGGQETGNEELGGSQEAPAFSVIEGVSSEDSLNIITHVTAAEEQMSISNVGAVIPGGGNISYSVTGGSDAHFFEMDGSEIRWKNGTPVYSQSPPDSDGDNTYEVTITATNTDGGAGATQTYYVTVGDRGSDGSGSTTPSINNHLNVAIVEGQTSVTALAVTNATGGPFSYSLSGTDAAYFSLDGSELRWQSAPNFASPNDADSDNHYEVTVRATNDSDGAFTDAAFNVYVLDTTAPIVLDLDGDGVEYAEHWVLYDMDGDGAGEYTAWAGADDGILAYDHNHDGVINQTDEISFTGYLQGAQTDLEGLHYFDTNGNQYLDQNDAAWTDFKIWQDTNQDGISQQHELFSLDQLGINNINLNSDQQYTNPHAGVYEYGQAQFELNGQTAQLADVAFAYAEQDSDINAFTFSDMGNIDTSVLANQQQPMTDSNIMEPIHLQQVSLIQQHFSDNVGAVSNELPAINHEEAAGVIVNSEDIITSHQDATIVLIDAELTAD